MAELSARNAVTVRLGDITVNRLGLGTNRIADNEQSRAVLKRAVELGINFIDTADKYGQSQEVIGQTLTPYRRGAIVATKGGWSEDNDPASLADKIDNSLKLLRLDQLPLWFLHRVDPSLPIEKTMEFLKSQQAAGKIRHIGLSEVKIDEIERARKVVEIVSVQNHYNLMEREHDDVLDYCQRESIVFIPFFPLRSGSVMLNRRLQEVADKYHKSPVQIAIAWLLARSPVMLPIPGTLSIEHLEANIAATAIKLKKKNYDYLSAG